MAAAVKSTIVRKQAAFLALRGGMRATQVVSRRAAAAWSERLFLTPRRYPVPERERGFLASGERSRLAFRGGELALWSWRAERPDSERPPVLVVHGWAGRAGQFASIVPALLAAGHPRVVAFDGPGHGASSGRRCSLPEMAESVRAVADAAFEAGAPVAVVAHSFGAPATVLAMRHGLAVERAAFLAPAADPMSFIYGFARRLAIAPTTLEMMVRRLEQRFGVPRADFDIAAAAPEVGLRAPLLVVHDWADAAVPFSDGQRLAAAWPGATLVTTAGLDHVRVLHWPEVVERVGEFLGAGAEALSG